MPTGRSRGSAVRCPIAFPCAIAMRSHLERSVVYLTAHQAGSMVQHSPRRPPSSLLHSATPASRTRAPMAVGRPMKIACATRPAPRCDDCLQDASDVFSSTPHACESSGVDHSEGRPYSRPWQTNAHGYTSFIVDGVGITQVGHHNRSCTSCNARCCDTTRTSTRVG